MNRMQLRDMARLARGTAVWCKSWDLNLYFLIPSSRPFVPTQICTYIKLVRATSSARGEIRKEKTDLLLASSIHRTLSTCVLWTLAVSHLQHLVPNVRPPTPGWLRQREPALYLTLTRLVPA